MVAQADQAARFECYGKRSASDLIYINIPNSIIELQFNHVQLYTIMSASAVC